MKRILMVFVLATLLGAAVPVQADSDSFGLAWGVSLPLGDTRDYISRVSFRGASVEWLHYYQRDAAYGISAGWNVFNKKSDTTLDFGDLAATGRLWQYVNAVPVYAGWYKYRTTDRRSLRLYGGLNAGAAWIERRTEMGLLKIEERNWHLALAPEIGVRLPYDSFLGFIGLRYHYAFSAGESEAQQWLELRIGFGMD